MVGTSNKLVPESWPLISYHYLDWSWWFHAQNGQLGELRISNLGMIPPMISAIMTCHLELSQVILRHPKLGNCLRTPRTPQGWISPYKAVPQLSLVKPSWRLSTQRNWLVIMIINYINLYQLWKTYIKSHIYICVCVNKYIYIDYKKNTHIFLLNFYMVQGGAP